VLNQLLARETRGEIKTPEQRRLLAQAHDAAQKNARKAAKSWKRSGNSRY
jgi:hypothetical protein